MKVNGLHSILIVKTAHSRYPLLMFEQLVIERGEWESMLGNVDAVDLMAVKFVDLQPKQFISTCSVATCGPPRITKHHGVIPRPKVAFEYLQFAAGIDIHNHLRTGSAGFEDVWLTKSPQHRQFTGIVGFLFTNAYQASKYFGDKSISHCAFKMDLSNRIVCFQDYNSVVLRRSLPATATETTKDASSHELASLAPIGVKKQKLCFYCQHGNEEALKTKTSFYCVTCGITYPICSPVARRNCWRLHVTHGMPDKKRRLNK